MIIHDAEELVGQEVRTRCGLTIARTPPKNKPDAPLWTGWWTRVTCPGCRQRYAHLPVCAQHYANNPAAHSGSTKPTIEIVADEDIEW